MIRFYSTLCGAFFACALFARHIPTPFDPVNQSPYAKSKHELAWDLRGFIYAAPTASVTYRMQLRGKESNGYTKNAFRIHAGGYFGFPFSKVADADVAAPSVAANFAYGPNTRHYTAGNLFVGMEKQHYLKRLVFYHGVEIGGGYSKFSSTYLNVNDPSGEQQNKQDVAETKMMLSGFAGLKLFLVPQVSVSVECNVFGGINFQHQQLDYYVSDAPGTNGLHATETLDKQKFFLDSNPLRTLNIAFHF